jgi:hypothetical protein
LLPRGLAAPPDADEAQSTADEAARRLTAALEHADQTEPLAALYRNLGLTAVEMQAVLLCLAPELDAKYQSVYGVLNDDLGRRTVTLGLLCALLGEPLTIRNALALSGGLTKWRLLESGTLPYADEPLRLDSAVVAWLLGNSNALVDDPRLRHLVRANEWAGASWMRQAADIDLTQNLARLLSSEGKDSGWIALSGEDTGSSKALIEAAAAQAKIPLLRVSLASLPGIASIEVDEIGSRLARAVQLTCAIPALDATKVGSDTFGPEGFARLVAPLGNTALTGVLVGSDARRLIGGLPRQQSHLFHRDQPDSVALGAIYTAAAAEKGLRLATDEAERLAIAFPLPVAMIDDAVRLAALQGAPLEPPERHFAFLTAACRSAASPDLPRFARRIEPLFRLDEVVLPADRRAQLDEMVAHVIHASKVLNGWGFRAQLPYGRGVAALFCGPTGTGKTMAAQAIARELKTETYAVDLSRVVSKYIGESEKNLDAVFHDAERAGAVLLFDEADALFGKRSEVKDAHDRYANIEVAYLLQRMELFAGLAILTTNFRQNLDHAFLRRLRFVVDFPRPDAEAREAIWRQCLPATAPVSHDVNVRYLAKRLELTGGTIRQITLRAAFAAASEEAGAIEMRHVVSATRSELVKLGMPTAERELAEFEASRRQSGTRAA